MNFSPSQKKANMIAYEDINKVIPYVTILNKTLRKFRTVCYSDISKKKLHFTCFLAFLSHCIQTSTPEFNKMRFLKYAIGKCLNNNSKFFSKGSPYDSIFNREDFVQTNQIQKKLLDFIGSLKGMGANGVLCQKTFFHKRLLSLFLNQTELVEAICHSLSDKVPLLLENNFQNLENFRKGISALFHVTTLFIELAADKETMNIHQDIPSLTNHDINILIYEGQEYYVIYPNSFALKAMIKPRFEQIDTLSSEAYTKNILNKDLELIELEEERLIIPSIEEVVKSFKNENKRPPSMLNNKKNFNSLLDLSKFIFHFDRKRESNPNQNPSSVNEIEKYLKEISGMIKQENIIKNNSEKGNVMELSRILPLALKTYEAPESDGSMKVKFDSCHHEFTKSKIKNQLAALKNHINCGPIQMVCMNSNCFSIMKDQTLIKVLGRISYNQFREGENVV